ncbi:MAG: type IV pilus modification protein PilV [Burkholderiales bacterium]
MITTRQTSSKRLRQSGMSLIEVLVAILIFSFGIAGLIGLQARAMQYSTSAEDTTRAALLASELSSTIVLNQPNPRAAIVIPAAAYAAWQVRVADPTTGGLPNGTGIVTGINANSANITITWQAPSAAAGSQRNQYVTQVIVP